MFSVDLHRRIQEKNSRVCVGLDPRLDWIPQHIQDAAVKEHGETLRAAGQAITEFNRAVIDAIAPFVPVVKPQIAFYEQYGPAGLEAFQETIEYAKSNDLSVVVDAKRGDIDSTAQAYANSFLGTTLVFGKQQPIYNVDCVTVNPFLGEDSLVPFIDTCQKYGNGIFVLVKTSNPGSGDLQDLEIDGQTVTTRMAHLVNRYAQESINSDGYSNIGAVVGATFPDEARRVRILMPNSIFLVPGIGAQGGNFSGLVNFFNADGLGAIVNSSRGLVFSQRENVGSDFQQVIVERTKEMVGEINKVLKV